MKHFCPLLFICLLLFSCGKKTSLVNQLKESEKIEGAYCFYPSTMRMLNFQNIASIDKLVKDVNKMIVLSMNTDSFSYEDLYDLSSQLQEQEAYDLYLEMTANDFQYVVLGKESPDRAMALVSQDDKCYIVDIKGRLNFMELSNAIDDISSTDSLNTSGYAMIFDMFKDDSNREERRRRRVREWEKCQAKEAAEARGEVYIDPDSIQIDTTVQKIEIK